MARVSPYTSLLSIALAACMSGCQVHLAIDTGSRPLENLVYASPAEAAPFTAVPRDWMQPKGTVPTSSIPHAVPPIAKAAAPLRQPETVKPELSKEALDSLRTVAGRRPTNTAHVDQGVEEAAQTASTGRMAQPTSPVNEPPRLLRVPPAPTPEDDDSADDQPAVARKPGEVPRTAAFNQSEDADPLPEESTETNGYPIDLPTTLRLAGAENWNVQLAIERVNEAWANYNAARFLWLPNLNAGVGYTKHEGQIQATEGRVSDISRNSLFLGGGAVVNQSPLAGGAGGPARFFVDLSLADAIFEPLAARQLHCAQQFEQCAVFNDTLLEATAAYYELAGAQARLSAARENLADAEEVLKLTSAFVAAGKGSAADTARVQVETDVRRQDAIEAEVAVKVASAELARVLQLDRDKLHPDITLHALDELPLPVELIQESLPLDALIETAHSARPEVSQWSSRVEAARLRTRQELFRPLIPHLNIGVSTGAFGGGVGDNLHQLDGRADFDLLAVWQVKNLGFGTHADRQRRDSQYRQAIFEFYRAQDIIAAEVSTAYHAVEGRRRQLELARTNIEQAENSYRRNLARIRGLEGLPLEALQAIQAVSQARLQFVTAVVAYNQAQAQLLRATGRAIEN